MSGVGVVGTGAWGITLSLLLDRKGIPVTLFGRREERVRELMEKRSDPHRLPGVRIPDGISMTADSNELADKDFIVFVIPSKYLRAVAQHVSLPEGTRVVSAIKGIETETGLRVSQVLQETLGPVRISALSGPSIAREVAADLPASVVVASEDHVLAREVQSLFHGHRFRVYTSTDLIGVEIGGAMKNVVAIAAGACDGLRLGSNVKGALLTRGIVEMMRLGMSLGADPITFSGLSGIGDLITTCMSDKSRNRHVGEQLGLGRSLAEIQNEMVMVAEGVSTTFAVLQLSRELGVELPITEAVVGILEGRITPLRAAERLMERGPKDETDIPWGSPSER
jgi:glycerol-3-phosphate dehydrogenase (NAD(P)+)